MSIEKERLWLVKASLLVTGTTFAFFAVAPFVLSFPMDGEEAIRQIQIVMPVFTGFLTTFVVYVVQTGGASSDGETSETRPLLSLVVRWPVYLLSTVLVIIILAFWFSNSTHGAPGGGMTLDQFSWFVSALMTLMSITSGVLVVSLFQKTVNER